MHSGESTFKHHERPISRARTMYRIPTAPNSKRTLELFHTSAPLLANVAWPSENVVCSVGVVAAGEVQKLSSGVGMHHVNYLEPLPFADGSFDLVIVHRTLDDLANSARHGGLAFDPLKLLSDIARVLVPGGLIAGCADNRAGIKAIVGRAKALLTGTKGSASIAHFTLPGLGKILTDANFYDVRRFSVLPSCENPLRLVEVDPFVSKPAFRREIEIARHTYSTTAYLARRLAVELGLYPFLEESIFLWAYTRC
jgi:SAM-dependent methyltransferase